MTTFHIGVTATREGLTGRQLEKIIEKLRYVSMNYDMDGVVLHQGCCQGGDEQITIVAATLGIPIVAHPPADKKLYSKIASELAQARMKDAHYLVRNAKIVDACELLIGAPAQETEQLRSGTWSTIRYARSKNKMMTLVWPDGSASDYA